MRRQTPGFLKRLSHVLWPEALQIAVWHKVCKTLFRPTANAVEWAAPSVNDDRLAAQVVGNIGGSGIDVWFQHRKRTGKDAWNRKVSGVFFCFLNRDGL
jgi:hypothetical protein